MTCAETYRNVHARFFCIRCLCTPIPYPRLLLRLSPLNDPKVLINALEHIPDMRVLLLGRVLGGISTSLLFSAFESWMVSEHRKQGEKQTKTKIPDETNRTSKRVPVDTSVSWDCSSGISTRRLVGVKTGRGENRYISGLRKNNFDGGVVAFACCVRNPTTVSRICVFNHTKRQPEPAFLLRVEHRPEETVAK